MILVVLSPSLLHCPLVCLSVFIYVYCHPQTYCFVVSQLFSVARRLDAGIETRPTLR